MPIELAMTAYSVAVLLAAILVYAVTANLQYGPGPLLGNRDDMAAPNPLVARASRVVDNHREGLILFAPLAVIAVVADKTSGQTALAAQLFFYARLAHAATYLIGIPYVRSASWLVGIVGTVMMFLALF